jgi:LysR family transcriptional regulator, regulator for bpeEF and oprC
VRPLRFRDADATRDVVLEHVVAASDVATQVAAALAGLGIAQVPLTREIRGQLAQRRLVPILEAYEPDGVPILLGHGAEVAPAFGAFRAWLADLYRSECLALSPRR